MKEFDIENTRKWEEFAKGTGNSRITNFFIFFILGSFISLLIFYFNNYSIENCTNLIFLSPIFCGLFGAIYPKSMGFIAGKVIVHTIGTSESPYHPNWEQRMEINDRQTNETMAEMKEFMKNNWNDKEKKE